jgi:pimeloyl-ACP methyl ester carboxylesterase
MSGGVMGGREAPLPVRSLTGKGACSPGLSERVSGRGDAQVDGLRFCGHSGGAQFAHRFWYLHPERVAAAAFSAPGRVTLVDDTIGWPSGTRDTAARFGIRVEPDALRTTPVHLVIGAEDRGEADLAATAAATPDQPGRTRLERLSALEDNLRDHGISISKTIVLAAGHDADATAPAISRFFGELPVPGHPRA